MKIICLDKASENFDDVDIVPKWIIIHCIGFDEDKALSILRYKNPNPELPSVCAHYFVPQRNLKTTSFLHAETPLYPVYRLVQDTKRARHAGVSKWHDLETFNQFSIGIEFHCPNYAYAMDRNENDLNWYHFEKFTDSQIQAGIELIKELIIKHNINPENILTHADIAPWRNNKNNEPAVAKTDPGAYFPMEKLAEQGIGIWPSFMRTRTEELDASVENTQNLLKTFGYNLEVTGKLDIPTQSSIRAFKIHFMPEEYQNDVVSDQINARMIIGLENLIDKQYQYKPGFGGLNVRAPQLGAFL